MLKISQRSVVALHEAGLRAFRPRLLAHWHQHLRGAGDQAGPDGRDAVLTQVEELAREDTGLSEADLTMLADLMLVNAASAKQRF